MKKMELSSFRVRRSLFSILYLLKTKDIQALFFPLLC
jgi:hypothetical protein